MSNIYDDIMNPTGSKNKVILSSQNVFSNSECIFVEYNDVISSPYYVFILNLIRTNAADDYFNFIFNKDTEDLTGKLFDWYINRKYINPLFNVGLKPKLNEYLKSSEFTGDYETNRAYFLDKFLYEYLNKAPEIYNEDGYLNFTNTLKTIIRINNLVKKVVIYSENYHEGIKKDIISLYGNDVIYVTGNIIEVLSRDDIPKDTTYVFSDVNKVYALKDTNRLNLSSVLIADKFGYNYDSSNHLLLDVSLFKDDRFNLNTFDNVHVLI